MATRRADHRPNRGLEELRRSTTSSRLTFLYSDSSIGRNLLQGGARKAPIDTRRLRQPASALNRRTPITRRIGPVGYEPSIRFGTEPHMPPDELVEFGRESVGLTRTRSLEDRHRGLPGQPFCSQQPDAVLYNGGRVRPSRSQARFMDPGPRSLWMKYLRSVHMPTDAGVRTCPWLAE